MKHAAYGMLLIIILVVFACLGLGRHGYASVLPAMQRSLDLTNAQTGQLQSWNLLGYLLTVVAAGYLAARFSPRSVITVSLLICASGMFVTGFLPTFTGACIGRFLTGVGGAGGNVPAMALVSAWFAPRQRGWAAGAAVGGSSLGLMVTGPLVPFVLQSRGPHGWQDCWYLLAGLTLAVFLLTTLWLRNHPAELGIQPVGHQATAGQQLAGRSSSASFQWSSVYQSTGLWQLACVYFAFGFAYIIYATFFVRYLTGEAGFSMASAGSLWFRVGIVSILSGFAWGSLSDRWGRKQALGAVFALQGLGFLLFGLSRHPVALYGSAVLFALTAWSVPALIAAICGDMFGARLAPAALGLVTIVFGIGQALGPYLAGVIADASQSFASAFLLAGLVAWAGAFGTAWLNLTGSHSSTPPQS